MHRSRSSSPRSTAVRQREDRDRKLLDGGAINAKQLADLQHELETLERRQASLEDSLLEVMERREELQARAGGRARPKSMRWRAIWPTPQRARDEALAGDRPGPHQACLAARRIDRRAGLRSGDALRTPARSAAARVRPGCRAAGAERAGSRSTAARSPGSRPPPRTRCCAAPSAAQSCCGSPAATSEGDRRGRRRVPRQSRARPATARWCGRPTTRPCWPKASRRSGMPPTTSPSTAV